MWCVDSRIVGSEQTTLLCNKAFSLVIREIALSRLGNVTENAVDRCARDSVFNI